MYNTLTRTALNHIPLKGLHRSLPELLKSITKSLQTWKQEGTTFRTKSTIIKTYALSRLTYFSYLESYKDDELANIKRVLNWFLFGSSTAQESAMALDRSLFHWKEGGLNLWDIKLRNEAQKIWVFNRYLFCRQCLEKDPLSSVFIPYMEQWNHQIDLIISKKSHVTDSKYLNSIRQKWLHFAMKIHDKKFEKQAKKYTPVLEKDHPLELNEINKLLLELDRENVALDQQKNICNFKSIRLTDGQRDNIFKYNLPMDNFRFVTHIREPKARNTVFRYLARCLPDFNWRGNDKCALCFQQYNKGTDHYYHYFFDCSTVLGYDPGSNKCDSGVVNTILKSIKLHSGQSVVAWEPSVLNFMNINRNPKLKKPRPYAHIVSIILHLIWRNICNLLYDNNISSNLCVRRKLSKAILSSKSIDEQYHRLLISENMKELFHFQRITIKNICNNQIPPSLENFKLHFSKKWKPYNFKFLDTYYN